MEQSRMVFWAPASVAAPWDPAGGTVPGGAQDTAREVRSALLPLSPGLTASLGLPGAL